MKSFERILICLIVISLILKFYLISGGDTILVLAGTILSFIYYPFGFLFLNQIRLRNIFKKDAYKNVSGWKIIFAILAGVAFSTTCIGVLFKFLGWTGADEMLIIGCSTTFSILIISLWHNFKKGDANTRFILARAIIIGGIGIILLFTSPLSLVKIQFRNHPAYINAYTEYSKDPSNAQLERKLDLEYHRAEMTPEDFNRYEQSNR